MMMIVMLMGLPGTGKSTFASALAHSLGAKHISSDIIRTELGRRGKYKQESKWLIYQEMAVQMLRALQLNQSVVLDATFTQAEWRAFFVRLAYPHEIKMIELTAAESVIAERLQHNRPFSEAKMPVYLQLKAEFEPEMTDHLTLDSGQTPTLNMVNEALHYLNVRQYEPQ